MTPYLKGNNLRCPRCEGSGHDPERVEFRAGEFEAANGRSWPAADVYADCEECKGREWLPRPVAEVIER